MRIRMQKNRKTHECGRVDLYKMNSLVMDRCSYDSYGCATKTMYVQVG